MSLKGYAMSLDLISRFWVLCYFPFQVHSVVQFSISLLYKSAVERKRHTVSVIISKLAFLLRITCFEPELDFSRPQPPDHFIWSPGRCPSLRTLTLHSFVSLTLPKSHLVSESFLGSATLLLDLPPPSLLLSAKYAFKRRKKQQKFALTSFMHT